MTSDSPFLREETIDVLAEIRDELREQLGRIANAIEKRPGPSVVPGLAGAIAVSQASLEKALQLVRDALDSKAGVFSRPLSVEDVDRLHEAEALLAAELGEPIWEGRRE